MDKPTSRSQLPRDAQRVAGKIRVPPALNAAVKAWHEKHGMKFARNAHRHLAKKG